MMDGGIVFCFGGVCNSLSDIETEPLAETPCVPCSPWPVWMRFVAKEVCHPNCLPFNK